MNGKQIACLLSHLKFLASFERTSGGGDQDAFEVRSHQTMSDDLLSFKNPFLMPWPETIEERVERYKLGIDDSLAEKVIAVVAEPIDGQ